MFQSNWESIKCHIFISAKYFLIRLVYTLSYWNLFFTWCSECSVLSKISLKSRLPSLMFLWLPVYNGQIESEKYCSVQHLEWIHRIELYWVLTPVTNLLIDLCNKCSFFSFQNKLNIQWDPINLHILVDQVRT